jgi:DNA modification methylase
LVEDQIRTWTDEGDVVYDCFMGSGTTAKVAEVLGRRWFGSEISEEYVKIAEERVRPYLASAEKAAV